MGLPEYSRRVQKMLLRRGNSAADAEDLVQEAFLKMQEYCARGGEIRQPEAFLVRTALRLGMNARRDAHLNLYVRESVEEVARLIDTNPTPDEVLEGDQCLERMRAALDTLTSKTKEVFFMRRLDGLTYEQIARQMNLSVSAIEKRMATALAVLSNVSDSE